MYIYPPIPWGRNFIKTLFSDNQVLIVGERALYKLYKITDINRENQHNGIHGETAN
jgi:hypothetical protein